MGRVIYIVPHPKTLISGGVKTPYRHVEMLEDAGFDALVFQPDGRPDWFFSRARVATALTGALSADDVLVFPENATGWVADMALRPAAARKVLFCQAQYFMFYSTIPAQSYGRVDFAAVACPSEIARGFLSRVFGFPNIAVLPCCVDATLFHPRPKTMQVAYVPHKLPREAQLLRTILALKYPDLAAIPWLPIEGRSEAEAAEIIGRSAIYLSLPLLESFGLVALEAMASRTLVIGFDGYGGKEYATPANGFWFEPEQLEEVADRLAVSVAAIGRGDPEIETMLDAGTATAARYGRDRARTILGEFYGALTAPRARA
jgi:glycosyltransferase involved in cell wall biosynthesis